MAAEEEPDALKIFWDHFFKSETGTYEKSTWLELFLAEFMIRLQNGADAKDLIKFCPVSGVVTLVGCELLCGVHRVTSSVHSLHVTSGADSAVGSPGVDRVDRLATEDTESEEAGCRPTSLFSRTNAQSATETLRRYVLAGVPWRCLVLLRALGVEGLSCCRQLSSVLIWLVGELGPAAGPGASSQPASTATPAASLPFILGTPRPLIHMLFSNSIWSKQKRIGNVTMKQRSQSPTKVHQYFYISGRSRHSFRSKLNLDSKTKRRGLTDSEQSSDTSESNDDLQIINRSMSIKVCSLSDDFDYFNCPKRSSNDYPSESLYSDPYYSPRKLKPKADDYMTDKHKDIVNSQVGIFELTLIITDLLQQLCKAESSLSGSEGSQISMQCINFSMKNLCALQFGSVPDNRTAYAPLEMSRVKLALTELLIVSLDQVLMHSDLCAKLINIGILPMLLRVLEDVICKSNAKYNTKAERNNQANDSEVPNEAESKNLLNFIFGIAYSIMAFFYCLLLQCRSVDKLREFTDQFKLFGECFKGGLLKECIELMIRIPATKEDETVILIKKLIESIGRLISTMKRIRSEVIHSAACPRSRHKPCRKRVLAGMHHHHDILGEAGAGLPLPSSCCVSILYGTLVSLVPDQEVSARKVLRNKILSDMLKCGVCCCVSPSFLMESIVKLMLTHHTVASHCLQLLEHTVYGDLGASVLIPRETDQLPCSICEQSDANRDVGRKYCPHGVSPMERKSVWSFLIHYNSLLQLDNHNDVLHATVSHLLKVTPKCRTEMKHELLFSVIYPTFIVSKHRYTMKLEESAYFLTVSCLNIFASLLNSVAFAEQFIKKGGLSYVLELVSLPEFSSQCCAILEIAIVVEIFKLTKENAELTYFREMRSLASIQILFKSLLEITDKCYQIYKQKIPQPKFDEICDLSKEKRALKLDTTADPDRDSKNVFLQPFERSGGNCMKSDSDEKVNNHIDILKNALTFWKSCAGLCLYSPMFREYAADEPVFLDSYALLKLVLHCLCNCHCDAQESKILIKIMEALLTVQFAVSDNTMGRSKVISCEVVREALATRTAACGGRLRPLCDALVAVAAARPSRRHAMPRTTPSKVPPLFCPSGGSSECSSSEDSAAGPYASEHSDPRLPPDDGYEADVEIGKLDVVGAFKVKGPADPLSVLNAVSDSQSGESTESACPEYRWEGELAHPELCVIVVDIVSQLVDNLLNEESEGEAREKKVEELERVCAGLARVGDAWGGADAPPLLERLLAPRAPATRLLARADHGLLELQRAVLELVVCAARRRLGAAELGAVLRLFAAERPPLAPLLGALTQLLAHQRPNTPDHELVFPIQLIIEESLAVDAVGSSFSQQAELQAHRLHLSHLRAGVTSPWSAGAVRCSLDGAGWAPWLQGFALVTWLYLQPPVSDQNEDWAEELDGDAPEGRGVPRAAAPLHLFSLGHDSLMFELWIDVATGSLCVRLSRPEARVNLCVSAARSQCALPLRRPACLALRVREAVQRRRMHVQVTVYIDGRECDTMALPVQGILVRKPTPTSVVMGHAGEVRAGGGEIRVSSVRVYRAPILTTPIALHLAAHGPHQPCQVGCEPPHYPPVITAHLLDADVDWDQVYEPAGGALRELHEHVLLVYAAHAPDAAHLHPQAAPAANVWSGRGASAGSERGEAPRTVRCLWAGRTRARHHCGFASALLQLGGPELLLYLYARVVELEGSAEQQAAALGVLLRAGALDARVAAALHAARSLSLVLPVLAAPQCRLSARTLQVILEAACNGTVMSVSGAGEGEVAALRADTDAVLLEPRLIKLIFRAWRHLETVQVKWDEGERRWGGSAWSLGLACVHALLRRSHPRASFNRYQAARVDLLRHLLLATKERLLNSECGPLDARASDLLVGVARALLGDPPAAPPSLNDLALLTDFLLLMHQAGDTFVTHSRADFYFLLTTDMPDTSDFKLLNLISKRHKTGQNVKMADAVDRSSASSVSNEDVTSDTLLSDPRVGPDREKEGVTDAGSGVESTKRLKGIINKKIKESRSKVSPSASDISDGTLEEKSSLDNKRAIESIEEGKKAKDKEIDLEVNNDEEVLHDFVILSESDLTADNAAADDELGGVVGDDNAYTEAAFAQQEVMGVRAGAEPGWRACEGLLLLLRDALAALPRDQLAQAASTVVSVELVAVLANHRTGSVRAAVLLVARELLRQSSPTVSHTTTPTPAHKHFFALLANQVSLYPATWELVAAAAALLTDRDVPLEDQLDAEVWAGFPEAATARAAPLLALLPLTTRDVPLAHNVVAVVRRLVDKVSIKALNEVALVEVLVRTVRAVGLDHDQYEGRSLLLEDLHDLLGRITVNTLAGNNNIQPLLDAHHLLHHVECEAGGEEGGVRAAARAAQAAMFAAQLDTLDARLRRTAVTPHTLATYLTNVLSSAAERSEAAEVRARRTAVQARAVAFLIESDLEPPGPPERALFCRLLDTLLNECVNDGGSGGRRNSGAGVNLAELFWWAVSPCVAARSLQPVLLRALYRAPTHVLHQIAPPTRDPAMLRKLTVYLLMLLRHVHLEAERGCDAVELAITDWVRDWVVRSQAGLADRIDGDALPAEAERMRRADRAARLAGDTRRRSAVGKSVFARDALARSLADAAMSVTRRAVDIQNAERKTFLEHLRVSQSHAAGAHARWQRLVDAHTHERGVWHEPNAYPASWRLDDVEGPGRVRVRLRRSHLRIPPRFLKTGYKYKSERALRTGPLRSVLGTGGGAAARLQAGEAVQHTARVRRVCVARDTPGDLLLTDRGLHFVPEDGGEARCWPLTTLSAVATRRWCLQERALELFLHSGHAHLIAFEDAAERVVFMKHLARAHLPDRSEQETLTEAMGQWRNGVITNWEYLMILNGLAGRSYNDLMQYPVFPFVIADYTSKILDLTDPASFRDLSRPMAVQNKNREQHYINTYNDLRAARREGCSPLLSRQPHHYASLYSNSGGVLHYLVRLPPFTELFLNYQDNNFDMPDRTFHSLATTWRLITNDSPTDVKELIPEMFYLPEMFYNNEGLELGVRQCGLRVDDVELPRWAADARLFTLVHRQALEAPTVTERLPHWIDLVFGYKQTGQAAIDAINVFPACTYYGFDPMALEDELDRTAAAAMVRTYGQAPRQLLRTPHPQRTPDLAPPPPRPTAQVYAGATGARWGRYCGSPERPPPAETARRACPGAARLQPLAKARAVAAVAPQTLLVLLRDEWTSSSTGEAGESVCAVSWGHSDGLVRVRRRRELPPEPLLHLPPTDQVTSACGWCGDGGAGWRGAVGALGLSSGRVLALRSRGGGAPRLTAQPLFAHSAPLAALQLCPRAGLLASASVDGLIVLWDLNELTYIRTLPNRGMLGVQCLAISETLSDVCSAHVPAALTDRASFADCAESPHADDGSHTDSAASDAYERDDTYKYKSLLRVHTVNGRFVGSVKVSEGVSCLQYSNAPEGASANCVAAALRSGGVRLYSSWELRPVAHVPPPDGCAMPLLSVAFSCDSQVLFGCYAGGVVVAWESADGGRAPPPRILPAHALL